MSYGDWAQWERRLVEAAAEARVIDGVNCLHLPGVAMCQDCWDLYGRIRLQHGKPLPRPGSLLGKREVARRLSGR